MRDRSTSRRGGNGHEGAGRDHEAPEGILAARALRARRGLRGLNPTYVVTQTPRIAWLVRADGACLAASRGLCEYAGTTPKRAQGHGWERLVHPDDFARDHEAWSIALARTGAWTGEWRLRRPDGSFRWNRVELSILPGRPAARLVTATDIEDDVRRRRLLCGQNHVLELVASGAPEAEVLDAIVALIESEANDVIATVMRRRGDTLWVASGPRLPAEYAAAIRGLPIGPDIGTCGTTAWTARGVDTVDIERDPRWCKDPGARALALRSGLRACWSRPILARDGSVIGTFALYRPRVGAPTPWDEELVRSAVHLARIAIERQIEEEQRGHLLTELRDAVRARDDFLAIASHELKTPLTSLQLGVESMAVRAEREAGPDWVLRQATAMTRQVRRLGVLVEQLLEVSRVTAGRLVLEREPVDLAEVVDDVVARFARELDLAGCALSVEGDRPVVGEWDRFRIDQIVTNLVGNAIKFGNHRPIEVRCELSDGTARLVVHDRGIGIDAEQKSRLFQRFERLVSRRHYGGFGLGLWIVRQIVEAHGGTIAVDSHAGEGTTIVVSLPVAPPASAEPPSADAAPASSRSAPTGASAPPPA